MAAATGGARKWGEAPGRASRLRARRQVFELQLQPLAEAELGVLALGLARELFLQREHALRARQRVERHAPLGDLDQVVAVDVAKAREREREAVLLDPLRRIVGRIALHAGVDAGADGVDVGPRTERAVAPVHLGSGEAG